MKSTQPSKDAWEGESVRVSLSGRKSPNAVKIIETFNMSIEEINGRVSFADLLRELLSEIEHNTDIPPDLVTEFNVKFVKRG